MKSILPLILIFILGFPNIPYPCTVIYATDGEKVLGGNNEDWSDPNTKLWFIPSSNGNYGWVKFGFAGGFPQGGMNEKGLFWDGTGCTFIDMPNSEKNKIKHDAPLMEKVIKECASVEEACVVFEKYYCQDQYRAQYLIGDANGNSLLVEGDSLIVKKGICQVAANFYHSHPELGGYPNKRYDRATLLLKIANKISTELLGSILYATHQDGKYPTQYSNIYDLREKVIYLFHQHNFEEFVTINLIEELEKPGHSYYLRNIFSNLQIISPESDNLEDPSSVTFKWEGHKTSKYDLYYSTDPDFGSDETFRISMSNSGIIPGFLFASSFLGMLFFSTMDMRDKRLFFIMLTIFAMIIFFSGCSEEITGPEETKIIEWSKTVINLEPNGQYYWKVIAHPEGESNFFSASRIHSFYTGE